MPLVRENQMEIILYVRDMPAEVRFYRDLLGLPLRFPKNTDDFSGMMWVEFDCGGFTLALHGGAQGKPDDLHEVVFWVDDVARTRQAIIAAGIEMAETRNLEDGAPIAEGRDPAGHRFAIRS